MAVISTKARKALPAESFALPAKRKFPIHDAAHVRSAERYLEKGKSDGTVTPADYKTARAAIAKAAKKFGVKSKYIPAKSTQLDLGVSDVSQAAPVAYAKTRRRPLEMTVTHPDGHKVEIRHLRDDVYALPAVELDEATHVALADSDLGEMKWIQLAKPGTFRGHRAGPFELNSEVFDEIIRNFKRDGQPIPIDHEHQSEMPAGELGPDGAPAQGWIRDMKIQGGNLWGLVQWNPKAREQIQANEYRYFSPAIRFGSKDRVTGEPVGARMTSGAMTNVPFLSQMQPLAASDALANAGSTLIAAASRAADMKAANLDAFAPKLRSALKLNELASMRECSDQLDRLRDLYETAPHAHATHQGVDLGAYTDALCSLTGMGGNTSIEELLDAVQEMIDAAIERHEAVYHSGESADAEPDDDGDEDTMTATDVASTQGEDAMSAELTARMKDTEDKLTALTAQFEAQKTEKAELTLKLRDAESRATALESEVKALKDAEAARVQAAQTARVDEAFDTYKDKKSLCAEDREAMVLTLRANPELFEKLYPRVSADKRHLLQNVSGTSVAAQTRPAATAPVAESVTLSLREMSRKIAAEKRIPLELAQLEAIRLLKKAG